MSHKNIDFLIAGNWKLNGDKRLFNEFVGLFDSEIKGVDVVVCPPYVLLNDNKELEFAVGAQNVSEHVGGAYTGEVSAEMLADAGCEYVIIGHSERREYQKEDNALINSKVKRAIDGGLLPILCIGESEDVRANGELFSFLAEQISSALDGLDSNSLANVAVAYEPIWAIGTGNTATTEQVQEVHSFVRGLLVELDSEVGQGMRLLYGGSVKPSNAGELFALNDVNGALVGGASLQAQTFYEICQQASDKR